MHTRILDDFERRVDEIAGFNFHLILQLEGTLRSFQPFCRTLIAFLSLGKAALLDSTQNPITR